MSTPIDTQRLLDFIRAAKAKGIDDTALVALLRQNGWSERRVYAALSSYYETTVGTEIPQRGGRGENARDAYLYLLAFAMLGTWTVALVWLGDVLIDRLFPSTLDYADFTNFRESVAGQIASLLVAFPLFLFMSRLIAHEVEQRPESLESGVRKWLTYLTLVVTAVTLIGDGVWFLQQFLVGDLTIRFVVKSLLLFIVAGGVLWYYLVAVRSTAPLPARDRAFGAVATAAVVLAVILGFTGIGSPMHQRAIDFDQERVSRLQSLAQDISAWYQEHHRLPVALGDVATTQRQVRDPVTEQMWTYIPGKGGAYELCGTFDIATQGKPPSFWDHAVGHRCFTLDAGKSVDMTTPTY